MGAADRDVPRVDDDSDLAARLVGRVDPLSALEHDGRQPVVVALGVPAQEVRARERGDERILRPRDELLGRSHLAQRSLDEDADGVRERGRVLVVVRDDQRRQVERAQQLLELGAHARLRVGVERGQRLVQEQHARVTRKRPRERHALPLAARELPGRAFARCEMWKRSSSSPTRSLPPYATFACTLRCGKSAYSWKTRPTRRSSGLRKSPRLDVDPHVVVERHPPASPAARGPRSRAGWTSCPPPKAPRARRCARPSSASLSSKERRAREKSAERVATTGSVSTKAGARR